MAQLSSKTKGTRLNRENTQCEQKRSHAQVTDWLGTDCAMTDWLKVDCEQSFVMLFA